MSLPKLNKTKLLEQVFRHQAQDNLEHFREYTLELESKFSADKNRLADTFLETMEGFNNDDLREIKDYYSDDYYVIEEIHIGLYRKSTLVSVYSFLENSLNILCRHMHKQYGYALEVADLRGEGIVRARLYLEKMSGINFSLINGEWSKIYSFNKIRNCIVHSEGNIKVSRSAAQLANIVNASPGLSLINEGYIKVERVYIDDIITTIEEFMNKLYDQIFSLNE